MLETIEQINYEKDSEIPKSVHYKAIHQRFRLEESTFSGIVELEGSNLMIQNKEKFYYLLFRDAPKELLEQLHDILKQVTISMYMRVPLAGAESIIEEEKYWPPRFAENVRRMGQRLGRSVEADLDKIRNEHKPA